MRALHSPDLCDLDSQTPNDVTKFGILVQVMVGPKGEPGNEAFDLTVCTPAWLAEGLAEQRFVVGRHHLIVDRYDYGVIKDAINQTFQGVTGASWGEVAERLARFGRWEFEDYRPYVEQSA